MPNLISVKIYATFLRIVDRKWNISAFNILTRLSISNIKPDKINFNTYYIILLANYLKVLLILI